MKVSDFDFRYMRIHGTVPCGEPEMHFGNGLFDNEHEPFYRYADLHPTLTYQLAVKGDSMINAGFYPGDIVFVDCSIEPVDGDIVIVTLNGEHTMKRLKITKKPRQECVELIAENPRYKPIAINEYDAFEVIGVVSGHFRKIR